MSGSDVASGAGQRVVDITVPVGDSTTTTAGAGEISAQRDCGVAVPSWVKSVTMLGTAVARGTTIDGAACDTGPRVRPMFTPQVAIATHSEVARMSQAAAKSLD